MRVFRPKAQPKKPMPERRKMIDFLSSRGLRPSIYMGLPDRRLEQMCNRYGIGLQRGQKSRSAPVEYGLGHHNAL